MDSAQTAARPVLIEDPPAGPSPIRLRGPHLSWAMVGAATGIVVAGVVLRFVTRSHLWLDEALTVNVARLPLRKLPTALRHDGAPPLYYVLLHLWIRAFGTSASAVRALSGVLGVASLPLIWIAGQRAAGPSRSARTTAGAIAVVLLASSPFAIRYSTEARMYSLVILLTILGYLTLGRAIDPRTARPSDLVGVTVVTAALLLTHYWALYLLATVVAMLIVRSRRGRPGERQATRRALFAVLAGAVLFIPWVPSFLYQLRHTGTPWAEPASFSAMVNAVGEFAGGRSSTGRALGLTFFALAGFGLFGAAVDHLRVEIDLRTRPRGRGFTLIVAGTLGLAIGAGFATGGAFQARYAAVVFAPFLLLVVLGTTVFLDRRVLLGVVAAAVGFGLATSTGNVTTDRTQAGQIAAVIRAQAHAGDLVAYCPDQLGPAASRLLPDGLSQLTFPRGTGPEFVDWVDYGAVNRAGDPNAFARFLDRRAGPGHTVWMVWAAQYRTLGTACEQINASLAALRPDANQLLEADTQHYFEHANLTRYRPR